MSAAALSILVYALYLLGQGIALLLVPNFVLPIVGLPEAMDVWVRVVGMTVTFFAINYFVAARYELRPFFVVSVTTRFSVPIVFAAFAIGGAASWNLLLLTPADVAFATWTLLALRRSPPMAAASLG
jgi:hypothetical protein